MTLDLFSSVLVNEDLRAFQVAMATLSETPRPEGETAFPDLGTILTEIADAHRVYRTKDEPPYDPTPIYAGKQLPERTR